MSNGAALRYFLSPASDEDAGYVWSAPHPASEGGSQPRFSLSADPVRVYFIRTGPEGLVAGWEAMDDPPVMEQGAFRSRKGESAFQAFLANSPPGTPFSEETVGLGMFSVPWPSRVFLPDIPARVWRSTRQKRAETDPLALQYELVRPVFGWNVRNGRLDVWILFWHKNQRDLYSGLESFHIYETDCEWPEQRQELARLGAWLDTVRFAGVSGQWKLGTQKREAKRKKVVLELHDWISGRTVIAAADVPFYPAKPPADASVRMRRMPDVWKEDLIGCGGKSASLL